MSFSIALSGLRAASSELNVTSNNIANVGTYGFKGSRAEFADVYSVDAFGSSETSIGAGTLLSNVRQMFNQGSLEYTEGGLDLAINGQGFFMTSTSSNNVDANYTRAGAFGVNASGYVVNAEGQYLQAFPVERDTGDVISTSMSSISSLRVPDSYGPPVPATQVSVGVNLPSEATDLPIGAFDPADADSYTNTATTTVYDTLGNAHTLQSYYIKTDSANNTWETRTYLDGNPMTVAAGSDETLTFDSSGVLTAPANGLVEYDPAALANGADPLDLDLNFSDPSGTDTTQFSSPFVVNSLSQNGAGTGRLNGLEVTESGVVMANYSNGKSRALGKVVIADFPNSQGLRQIGNTMWRETMDSGQVLIGEAGGGRFGTVQAGALEGSNVDLTTQLVKLITAQRNFQASAKAIETSNTVTQTIIQI